MSKRRITNVETDKAIRGLWLVKVPKYMSELWEANPGIDVGKLRLTQTPRGTDVKLLSKPGLNPVLKPSGGITHIPDEHSFLLNDVRGQIMQVLLEDKTGLNENANTKSGKLLMEGRIVKRADCNPVRGSESYMKYKISQIQTSMQPKKRVQLLDRAVVTNKPINIHEEDLARLKQKKEGAKNVRSDRDIVTNLIFQAFEKHQYYRLQDLQQCIQQPQNYIKEILQDIAIYNSAPPHKNMWELKPEYRNYKLPKTDDQD